MHHDEHDHDGHDHDGHAHVGHAHAGHAHAGHAHAAHHSGRAGGQTHAHPPQADHDAAAASPYEVLERAIRTLLTDKGVLSEAEIAAQIDLMDSRSGALGARVVARAWVDEAYKGRLLADTRSALAELGIDIGTLAEFRTVANGPGLHNVVVCTLCSCYPKLLLGIPPAWYKSLAYRSRVVRDPRGVLAEFGVSIAQGVEVRVHDSTADLRYLVLPMRPAGTDGLGEDELARLVTRDCMIGTALPLPAPVR